MLGRAVSAVAGILLVMVGSVWLLQGLNVLPGSFMTGSALWGIIGTLSFTLGVVILYELLRNRAGR